MAQDEVASTDEGEAPAIEVEEMVDAANAPGQDNIVPPSENMIPTAAAIGNESRVARLFEAIRGERGSDGSLRIEAPPAAAGALASLFDGMARLLTAVAAPPAAEPEQHPPSPPS